MIRRVGSTGSERIRALEYNELVFRSDYEECIEAMCDGCPEEIPGYVARESDTYVFILHLSRVVLKIPDEVSDSPAAYRNANRLAALFRAEGELYLEQLYGYSCLHPHVITDYVPGKMLWEMSDDERSVIPDECYAALIKTFARMAELGLAPDWGSDNFIFGSQGLTVIDFRIVSQQRSLLERIARFASDTLIDQRDLKDIPEYALRFREVCGRVLGAQAVRAIDKAWVEDVVFA